MTAAAASGAVRVLDGKPCVPQKWAAAFLGITAQTFRGFGIEPHAMVSTRPWYAVETIFEKWAERAGYGVAEKATSRDRFTEMRIAAMELDLQERLGAVVHRDAVSGATDSIASEAGAIISGVPHSVAHEIAGKTDPLEIAAILERHLAGARAKIAELAVVVPAVSGHREGHGTLNGH